MAGHDSLPRRGQVRLDTSFEGGLGAGVVAEERPAAKGSGSGAASYAREIAIDREKSAVDAVHYGGHCAAISARFSSTRRRRAGLNRRRRSRSFTRRSTTRSRRPCAAGNRVPADGGGTSRARERRRSLLGSSSRHPSSLGRRDFDSHLDRVAVPAAGATLSMKARFRGPLLAQTSN